MPMIFSLLAMFSRPAFVPISILSPVFSIINPSFVVREICGLGLGEGKEGQVPFLHPLRVLTPGLNP